MHYVVYLIAYHSDPKSNSVEYRHENKRRMTKKHRKTIEINQYRAGASAFLDFLAELRDPRLTSPSSPSDDRELSIPLVHYS